MPFYLNFLTITSIFATVFFFFLFDDSFDLDGLVEPALSISHSRLPRDPRFLQTQKDVMSERPPGKRHSGIFKNDTSLSEILARKLAPYLPEPPSPEQSEDTLRVTLPPGHPPTDGADEGAEILRARGCPYADSCPFSDGKRIPTWLTSQNGTQNFALSHLTKADEMSVSLLDGSVIFVLDVVHHAFGERDENGERFDTFERYALPASAYFEHLQDPGWLTSSAVEKVISHDWQQFYKDKIDGRITKFAFSHDRRYFAVQFRAPETRMQGNEVSAIVFVHHLRVYEFAHFTRGASITTPFSRDDVAEHAKTITVENFSSMTAFTSLTITDNQIFYSYEDDKFIFRSIPNPFYSPGDPAFQERMGPEKNDPGATLHRRTTYLDAHMHDVRENLVPHSHAQVLRLHKDGSWPKCDRSAVDALTGLCPAESTSVFAVSIETSSLEEVDMKVLISNQYKFTHAGDKRPENMHEDTGRDLSDVPVPPLIIDDASRFGVAKVIVDMSAELGTSERSMAYVYDPVTAQSVDRDFTIVALSPKILTVDAYHKSSQFTISNMGTRVRYTNVAVNRLGSLLATIDNNYDVIVFHRLTLTDLRRSGEILAAQSMLGFEEYLFFDFLGFDTYGYTDEYGNTLPSDDYANFAKSDVSDDAFSWSIKVQIKLPLRFRRMTIADMLLVSSNELSTVIADYEDSSNDLVDFLVIVFTNGVIAAINVSDDSLMISNVDYLSDWEFFLGLSAITAFLSVQFCCRNVRIELGPMPAAAARGGSGARSGGGNDGGGGGHRRGRSRGGHRHAASEGNISSNRSGGGGSGGGSGNAQLRRRTRQAAAGDSGALSPLRSVSQSLEGVARRIRDQRARRLLGADRSNRSSFAPLSAPTSNGSAQPEVERALFRRDLAERITGAGAEETSARRQAASSSSVRFSSSANSSPRFRVRESNASRASAEVKSDALGEEVAPPSSSPSSSSGSPSASSLRRRRRRRSSSPAPFAEALRGNFLSIPATRGNAPPGTSPSLRSHASSIGNAERKEPEPDVLSLWDVATPASSNSPRTNASTSDDADADADADTYPSSPSLPSSIRTAQLSPLSDSSSARTPSLSSASSPLDSEPRASSAFGSAPAVSTTAEAKEESRSSISDPNYTLPAAHTHAPRALNLSERLARTHSAPHAPAGPRGISPPAQSPSPIARLDTPYADGGGSAFHHSFYSDLPSQPRANPSHSQALSHSSSPTLLQKRSSDGLSLHLGEDDDEDNGEEKVSPPNSVSSSSLAALSSSPSFSSSSLGSSGADVDGEVDVDREDVDELELSPSLLTETTTALSPTVVDATSST